MSIAIITRLTVGHLKAMQVAVGSDTATIADVISMLQANVSTQSAPLNTSCPTCVANDAPTGFLTTTKPVSGLKVPCTTCKGYLLYYTAQGQVTPPTNPFGAATLPAWVRMLPADLTEALLAFPDSTTLATMITSLLANYVTPPTNTCAVCSGTGSLADPASICYLCFGATLTPILYSMVNGVPMPVTPTIPPPNPLPSPYNPFSHT